LPIVSLEILGSGGFAKVYKGIWTEDRYGCEANSAIAVKVINAQQSRPRLTADGSMVPPKWLEREVKINDVQYHENLIRVIHSSIDTLPYIILLEYCAGGSLHEHISGDPSTTLNNFGWHHRVKAALDIAAGMANLHEQRVVHRDLKAQNVLLANPVRTVFDEVHAKVCDFGLARYLPQDEQQTVLTRQVGSWYFMAPEIFTAGDCKYDETVDVYSFGMLLYQMVAGNMFFDNEAMSFPEFVIFASAGGRPREDAIPDGTPEVLRVLMKEAWHASPASRPSFSDMTNRLRHRQAMFPLVADPVPSRSDRGGFASLFCCVSRQC